MNKEKAPSIVIRDLVKGNELRAVEELQKQVWGVPDLDVVPVSQLIAARTAGGILLGAFDGDEMVGFVYGFVGLEEGGPAHHSHMLAVRPEYRNLNLGRRLKLEQRDRVLDQGMELMTWTFDPLQSLNAHFNFTKLGVVSDRYFVDFYGVDASSFLHRNGTDRLWVTWNLDSKRVRERASDIYFQGEQPEAPLLLEFAADGSPRFGDTGNILALQDAYIEIPLNMGEIEERDPDLAAEWRLATRSAFTKATRAGYIVRDFFLRDDGGKKRGAYFLVRNYDEQEDI
jgi:predicted GNAT superfamily acetyltransferase